jgi:hypothetical protein
MRTNITREVPHSMCRSMGLKKETQSQELAAAAKSSAVKWSSLQFDERAPRFCLSNIIIKNGTQNIIKDRKYVQTLTCCVGDPVLVHFCH